MEINISYISPHGNRGYLSEDDGIVADSNIRYIYRFTKHNNRPLIYHYSDGDVVSNCI